MAFSTVLIISLAAGVVLVIGGGVLVYMSNLVRSAYEIKVQLNNEVDERLTKMSDDLDKKSRWIKRDLLEEIEKIKTALHTDSARKIGELADPLGKRLEAIEAKLAADRTEWIKAIEADRAALTSLDTRLKAVTRQVQKKEPEKAEEPAAEPAMDEAAVVLAAQAAAAGGPAKPAEQPEATKG